MNKDNIRKHAGSKFRRLALVALVIASLLSLLYVTRPVAAQGLPIVRCEPLSVNGQVGQQLFVDMYIENVTNLYGLQSRISFDTTKVQAVDQDGIFPGVQILPIVTWLVPGFIVEREADNTLGIVEYSMTQLDPQPPANGSGAIARIVFLGISAGSFTMVWDDSYVLLSAPAGVPIPSTNQDCQVTISGPTAVTLSGLEAASSGPAGTALAGVTLLALCLTVAVVWLRARNLRRKSA